MTSLQTLINQGHTPEQISDMLGIPLDEVLKELSGAGNVKELLSSEKLLEQALPFAIKTLHNLMIVGETEYVKLGAAKTIVALSKGSILLDIEPVRDEGKEESEKKVSLGKLQQLWKEMQDASSKYNAEGENSLPRTKVNGNVIEIST